MRYRRFGNSELVVSEVGFGAWTIATDWWGKVDDKAGLVHEALDAGVTFFDTAPVYGEDGFGETILAELLGRRDDVVLTTKCGYDIDAPRIAPGHSERPQDWRPESVRAQVEASLRRFDRDHIDLLQLHNVRIEPVRDDALWDELERLRVEGKVREIGVALGPAIGWQDEGLESLQNRAIVSVQTVFNLLEQEPGRSFAAEPAVTEGRVGLIARVPHASDVLSGKVTRDTVFEGDDHRAHRKRENLLDLFDKADTLTFLHGPETGRTIGQGAVAGILAMDGFTTVLPTCVTADEVREYAAASDLPLSTDEKAEVDARWRDNFGVTDRYEMPLKSSG
ncbi:MAG: aldo/keto reductase [Actinomycetota bacterium]|nr:aldo/keto reductase [Actinomycetota bacterium]